MRSLIGFIVPVLITAANTSDPSPFPHASIMLPTGKAEAEFHVSGEFAMLTARTADGSVIPIETVTSVDSALEILADRRLAFAWPALLAWAGNDLGALRDRALSRNRLAAESGVVISRPQQAERWTGDQALSALMIYARTLIVSGQVPAAISVMKEQLAKTPHDADHEHMRILLTVRIANTLFQANQVADAIAILDAAEGDKSLEGPSKLNLDVGLAILLARSGQSVRALKLIMEAWETFDKEAADSENYFHVPSSEANFAWIKACALDGTGEHAKARQLLSGIQVDKSWPDRDSTGADGRIYGYLCMKDDAGLAVEIASQLETAPPGSDLFVKIQPEAQQYSTDAATVSAAIHRPAVARIISTRVRMLGAEFGPAISKWKAAAR